MQLICRATQSRMSCEWVPAAEKVSVKASDHDGGNVSLLDFFIMI